MAAATALATSSASHLSNAAAATATVQSLADSPTLATALSVPALIYNANAREAALGRMRCLHALGEWEQLLSECWPLFQSQPQAQLQQTPTQSQPSTGPASMATMASLANLAGLNQSMSTPSTSPTSAQVSTPPVASATGSLAASLAIPTRARTSLLQDFAPVAASAAWYLQDWDKLQAFTQVLDERDVDGAFYRAVIHLYFDQYSEAKNFIDISRDLLDAELTALFSESYQRAYGSLIRAQQLSELEVTNPSIHSKAELC